jgi:hypothetical protein
MWQLTISTTSGSAAQARSLTYRSSGQVPAHQARWVRLLGRTHPCSGTDKGGASGTPTLSLHVRIGWISRTEVVAASPLMVLDGVCTG